MALRDLLSLLGDELADVDEGQMPSKYTSGSQA